MFMDSPSLSALDTCGMLVSENDSRLYCTVPSLLVCGMKRCLDVYCFAVSPTDRLTGVGSDLFKCVALEVVGDRGIGMEWNGARMVQGWCCAVLCWCLVGWRRGGVFGMLLCCAVRFKGCAGVSVLSPGEVSLGTVQEERFTNCALYFSFE